MPITRFQTIPADDPPRLVVVRRGENEYREIGIAASAWLAEIPEHVPEPEEPTIALGERIAIQIWAELYGGANVAVGTQARYFGRAYERREIHSKPLLRSMISTQYWRGATE